MAAVLATALVTSDVLGRSHVLQRAKKAGIEPDPEKFADPIESKVFQGGTPVVPRAALEFLKRRVPLPSGTIERLVARAGIRGEAATRELTAQLLEQIDDELRAAIRAGEGVESFAKRIQDVLARAGLDPASPFRIETIFRNNTNQAYTAGRLEMVEHPDVAAEFQWLQYNAVMDGATRPTHAAMNGRVFRVDSPVWDQWMPPNGHNCRCSVTPVAREDIRAEKLSVRRKPPRFRGNTVRPDVGFRQNSARALRRNPATAIG